MYRDLPPAVWGKLMHRMAAVAVAALVACAFSVTAAHAYDCDPEDAADLEKCVRGVKVPSIRQFVPPSVRRAAEAAEACDPEDVADVAKCLREARLPGVRRSMPDAEDEPGEPEAKKAAGKPETPRQAPLAKAEIAPTPTIASSEPQAKVDDGRNVPHCQKYIPSIGKSVSVPCE